MTATTISKAGWVLGGLLLLLGILVPSAVLIEAIRAVPPELRDQLVLGATLFRVCLAVLGGLVIFLAATDFWRADSFSPITAPPRRVVVALASLLAAGLILRLYDLNDGLWVDEIQTWVTSARLPLGEIATTYVGENQHILYSLLAHVSLTLFGETGWALRLPAVLFGVGSILALYLVGQELTSRSEALLASALLTFSYHHVWFSQDARGYTGLLFWVLVSTACLLRALRAGRPQAWWLAFAAASALGAYTQLVMVFIIAGDFVVYAWVLFARREQSMPSRWAGLGFGFLACAFLGLLLHALLLPQMLTGLGTDPSVVEAWRSPLWTLLELARGVRVGFAGWLAAGVAVGVFCAGLYSYARSRPVLLLLLLVSPALLAATTVALGHHLWPRFFFYVIGFAALVAVRGTMATASWLARLAHAAPEKARWLGAIGCIGLIVVSAMSVPLAYRPKQDYGGAKSFVEANVQPGDAVATVGPAGWVYQNFYEAAWNRVTSLDALNALRAQSSRTWVVYAFPTVVQSQYPEIMANIRSDFVTVKEFGGTVGDGTVYVGLAEAGPPSAGGAVSPEP